MRLLTSIIFIFLHFSTFGQPYAIPEGYLIKYQAKNVDEEFVIVYAVDFETVKNLFSANDLRPYYLKESGMPAFLDSARTYVLAAFIVVYCTDCYYDDQKVEYEATNWIITNPENLSLNSKALGNYMAIETGKWTNNSNVITIFNRNGLSFEKATFDRRATGNKVEYRIASDLFDMSISFERDSTAEDPGNKGLYQTVWSTDRRHFTVYSSFGQRERNVTSSNILIKTNDPILEKANRPTHVTISESWTAISGTYKNR